MLYNGGQPKEARMGKTKKPTRMVSYRLPLDTIEKLHDLSVNDNRNMTSMIATLINDAYDGEAVYHPRSVAVPAPQPPTLRDGRNYDSLSYSAKHRASQARAARSRAALAKKEQAKMREDAYAAAPKDWSSDPS